jgi:hypothetical protein
LADYCSSFFVSRIILSAGEECGGMQQEETSSIYREEKKLLIRGIKAIAGRSEIFFEGPFLNFIGQKLSE